MHLVSVKQMLSLEAEANSSGLSYAQMMYKAGSGLAHLLKERFSLLKNPIILGLVGSGNNGGDTLIALSQLAKSNWDVCVYLVKPRPSNEVFVKELNERGALIINEYDDQDFSTLGDLLGKATVLLDGILGTGIKLPLVSRLAQILNFCQNHANRPYTVAVDCPSGVDCSTGDAAKECIPANMTVCMGAVKKGLLEFPAFNFVGDLKTVDIGLTSQLNAWGANQDKVVDAEMIKQLLPTRPLNAHKGTFGTSLITAGSTNYAGAVLMAGKAAYRMGAGLVRIAIPGNLFPALAGQLPEATWLLLPHSDDVIGQDGAELLLDNLQKVTSILLGPGWGLGKTTQKFLENLLRNIGKPQRQSSLDFSQTNSPVSTIPMDQTPTMVLDADALKLLAHIKNWHELLPKNSILTPHLGEMAALTGLEISAIQTDRIEIARKYSTQWGHVLVLKGALSVVANPEGFVWIIPVATPALAKAGTGDVLAGMIAGLCAQGLKSFDAAAIGAWVHAKAGLMAKDLLRSEISVMASDVIESIPKVLGELENKNRRW